jgi:hypothetical protein
VDGTGPDQSKPQVGKPIHNVTLKLTLTVSTVLVPQTQFRNPIFMPEKNLYLAVFVKDELLIVQANKSDFAISYCSEINTICSDYCSLLGFYTV